MEWQYKNLSVLTSVFGRKLDWYDINRGINYILMNAINPIYLLYATPAEKRRQGDGDVTHGDVKCIHAANVQGTTYHSH